MNRIISNSIKDCKRYSLVIGAIILVLLSSCIIKTGLEAFLKLPLKTEQIHPGNSQLYSENTVDNCTFTDLSDNKIVQEASFNTKHLLPAFILTSFFLLTGFHPVRKEDKHPLYNGSRKIRYDIPLFLEYRKLIIHYIC